MSGREVLEFLKGCPALELPGIPVADHECQGALFHSPRPMVVHLFRTKTDNETVHLCGTCADNVRLLLVMNTTGPVPWDVKRCFGNSVRRWVGQSITEENHA